MHGLLASLAIGVAFSAFKFFARHGGSISALNSASTDSRSARRRSKDSARARRHQAAAGRRRARLVRQETQRQARR